MNIHWLCQILLFLIINNDFQKSLNFCHAFCPHTYLESSEFSRIFRNIKTSLTRLIIVFNISVANVQGESFHVFYIKMCL